MLILNGEKATVEQRIEALEVEVTELNLRIQRLKAILKKILTQFDEQTQGEMTRAIDSA